tara:strand:- start:627 stop:1226 length:600 start_codon:yes stop_codon:yes gene_type:complete
MNTKTILQLIIFFTIIIFLFLFLKNTFYLNKSQIIEVSESEQELFEETSDSSNKNKKNFIQNLNYSTVDSNGNHFNLNAEFGEESEEDVNILILNNVVGKIKVKDKSEIIIKSDYAKYNSSSFDTEFYQNVLGLYEEKKFYSDNLDLLFKNNKAIIYNNIKYFDNKIESTADEIEFDIIKGDIAIKMFNKKEKIKILQK